MSKPKTTLLEKIHWDRSRQYKVDRELWETIYVSEFRKGVLPKEAIQELATEIEILDALSDQAMDESWIGQGLTSWTPSLPITLHYQTLYNELRDHLQRTSKDCPRFTLGIPKDLHAINGVYPRTRGDPMRGPHASTHIRALVFFDSGRFHLASTP